MGERKYWLVSERLGVPTEHVYHGTRRTEAVFNGQTGLPEPCDELLYRCLRTGDLRRWGIVAARD